MTEEPQQVFDFRKSSTEGEGVRVSYELVRPVFFVGFMGAGKTSVARKLARNAGVAAVDMDRYIERHSDRKIKDIFEELGEAGFRAIETEVLRELATGEPQLVSCGGGVVLSQANRDILREHGFVVYLKVSAEEAASRISNLSSRPLFGDLGRAQRINEDRLSLYEEVADLVIDTAGRGSGSIARETFSLLLREGALKRVSQQGA